jgi:hypothetical protein
MPLIMKATGSEQKMEAGAEAGADLALVASVASIALSWYAFFVRGDRDLGVFVGLWPPTILALANHFKQREFEQRIKMIPTAPVGSNVRETIEELMGA